MMTQAQSFKNSEVKLEENLTEKNSKKELIDPILTKLDLNNFERSEIENISKALEILENFKVHMIIQG